MGRLIFSLLIGFSFLFSGLVTAQTSSPFMPPEEALGVYVVNSGQGLDTGCTYRSGGPLIINLTVPATMNPNELDSNGFLREPGKLIANKVIGSTAKISFPIYDIDDSASTSGFAPEIDNVSFNGEFVKSLSGINNTWVNDSFTIDISKVKFNTENEIRVDIDEGNIGGGEYWCMSVDWISIEYDTAFPYVLVHGISADASSWEQSSSPGVLTTLEETGVLYTRFSTSDSNGSVSQNSRELKANIQTYLETVKAKKVHLIAHSKGGLDSQALAKLSPPEFEVASLSTLSTPHRGSVTADLQLIQRTVADFFVNQGQDPNGYAQQYVNRTLAGYASGFGAGPQPPGLNDLTTQAATSAILAGIRGNVGNTFTIGADAGPNCSRPITDAEISPMADDAPSLLWIKDYVEETLRVSYQTICDFSSAVLLDTDYTFVWTGNSGQNITTVTYSTITSSTSRPNDVVVAEASANPGWGTPLGNNTSTNHSEVKNGANVQEFLDRTIQMR